MGVPEDIRDLQDRVDELERLVAIPHPPPAPVAFIVDPVSDKTQDRGGRIRGAR